MATSSNYYIDTTTFATATSVFMNQNLSVLAPDGIYSFGTTTREQSAGVLLTAVTCAPCGTPCGTSINSGGSTGIYIVNLEVGSLGTGAILVRFNPDGVPDGIRATYNGVVYNKLSSQSVGVRQSSNYGHYTIVGTTGSTGTCSSWYPSGGTLTQSVKVYNPATSTFVATVPASTQTNTIDTGDFFIGSRVNDCWMVIPKPTATPSAVLIEIIGPCTNTSWSFSAYCPVALPSFSASNVFTNGPEACGNAMPNTFYFAKVHAAADTYVGLYDYVFTDVNGQFPLTDGFYLTSNVAGLSKVIEVDNGVIVSITDCGGIPFSSTSVQTTAAAACSSAQNQTYYATTATITIGSDVYSNSILTTSLPDGFYTSDNLIGGEWFQVTSGEITDIDICSVPCGDPISTTVITGSTIFNINLSLGTATGAVVLTFDPQNIPDGILATLNSIGYNKLSSPVLGVLQSSVAGPTYIGRSSFTSGCSSWYPSGGNVNLTVWNWNGTAFVNTSVVVPTTIDVNQIEVTSAAPDICVMVIPKPTTANLVLNVKLFGPCTSTGWDITAPCPVALPSFTGSVRFTTASIPCATAMAQTYYFAKVHKQLDTYIGLYDYIFTDENGEFPLTDGFYLISNVDLPNQVMQVVNGVVIAITNCI